MRVLIVGTGALGCVVGGFMKKAGHEVTLVGRTKMMDAIQTEGLYISGIWGNHHISGLHTSYKVSLEWKGQFDLIILSVKSYDTETAMQDILPIISNNVFVCSYQNGLGNVEKIAQFAGMDKTIPARVIFGSRILKPGFVQVTVIAEPTALGRFNDGPDETIIRNIVEQMDKSGIPTIYTENIEGKMWEKVVYNSALNPLSALLDVPYGRLLDTEETQVLMKEVINEIYAVALAKQVPMIISTPEEYIQHLFYKLIPPTAEHYASMREDLKQGRKTEIDALNGAIVKIGKELNIDCPTNQFLTQLIKAKEQMAIMNL
ncbi:MAG TPA: ketopantoate reductase family protein [Candidatus Hydrogenedens sp.]|nr:ketopantoate reductase family protein [Candidatus Hydrogenedens sp.]